MYLGDPEKKYGDGSANNAAVTDVELLGAWNGIAAVAAHRHYMARVQGQPLNIGVFVDETYDIGRIENVHFNPWFSDAHPFIWYVGYFFLFCVRTVDRLMQIFLLLTFLFFSFFFLLPPIGIKQHTGEHSSWVVLIGSMYSTRLRLRTRLDITLSNVRLDQ